MMNTRLAAERLTVITLLVLLSGCGFQENPALNAQQAFCDDVAEAERRFREARDVYQDTGHVTVTVEDFGYFASQFREDATLLNDAGVTKGEGPALEIAGHMAEWDREGGIDPRGTPPADFALDSLVFAFQGTYEQVCAPILGPQSN